MCGVCEVGCLWCVMCVGCDMCEVGCVWCVRCVWGV